MNVCALEYPPELDPESDPRKTPYRLLVSRDVFCVIVSLIFCAVERERVDDSTIGFRQRATLQTKSLSAKKMKFEVTVKDYIWNTNADPQKVMVLPNVGAYIPYPMGLEFFCIHLSVLPGVFVFLGAREGIQEC